MWIHGLEAHATGQKKALAPGEAKAFKYLISLPYLAAAALAAASITSSATLRGQGE